MGLLQSEYLELIDKIAQSTNIPPITDIYIPGANKGDISAQKNTFGALVIGNKHVGMMYLNLNQDAFAGIDINLKDYIGKSPVEVAQGFSSTNEIEKTIALGAINAISQYVLEKSNYSFEKSKDSFGEINLTPEDKIGMVGFFPPLIKQLKKEKVFVTIIEKKEALVSENEFWKVTLDPAELQDKNKIIATSTVVLNDTLDDILSNCQIAEKIVIMGPTGGYLPDPLFKRGVNAVGGAKIHDVPLFLELLKTNQRWSRATFKYLITKEKYLGIDHLLKKIKL